MLVEPSEKAGCLFGGECRGVLAEEPEPESGSAEDGLFARGKARVIDIEADSHMWSPCVGGGAGCRALQSLLGSHFEPGT